MPSMTSGQNDLMARLRDNVPALTVRWDEPRGVIRLVRGLPLRTLAERAAIDFVANFAGLFGPSDLARWLRLLHTRTDRLGWRHMEYQQEYQLGPGRSRKGRIPVYGSRLTLHFTPRGELAEVWSNCWRDVRVAGPPRITAARVRRLLGDAVDAVAGRAIPRRQAKTAQAVLLDDPRLVVYPWRGGFRLAWTALGHAPVHAAGPDGPVTVEAGEIFVDARTGEMFVFFPFRMHVVGSGAGVTPLGGPFAPRVLEVEREGVGPRHRLRDTTRARSIVTYHDACRARTGAWFARCDALMGDILSGVTEVSKNDTGPDWLTAAATTAPADREASQQPEVDGHFFAGQAYDWYAAVGARVGWDDNAFPGLVEVDLPVRVVVHTRDPIAGTCHTAWSQFWRANVGGLWRAFVMFCDGNPISTSPNVPRSVDYPSGNRALVGHEYQHVVTFFSFRNDLGQPGIGYDGWAAALHEGLSDAFGCMFADDWALGTQISHDVPPRPIRNLAYPRDPDSWENRPGGLGHANKDHFDDRTLAPTTTPGAGSLGAYDHGTILGHCAFLMAAGGVHRRDGQPPRAPLIPVARLGSDVVGAVSVSRAARIWYEALASFSATLGQVTSSDIDEDLFRGFRDACESAAIAAYGAGSLEHRVTLLAFHAVGLDVPGVPYGADLAFLPWAAEWRLSRPYLGGIRSTCPDWASIDLFVNNGGASGWNAVVDTVGPGGAPIGFENHVYCRVRNVGDQKATNITVDLFWTKVGPMPTVWQAVTDLAGNVQQLVIAELDAGRLSFEESDQDSPPAQSGVSWHIPPLAPGEIVDHFCLRAVVASADDVNPYNEVQSNVAYTLLAARAGRPLRLAFVLANPHDFGLDEELAEVWSNCWRNVTVALAPRLTAAGMRRTVGDAVNAVRGRVVPPRRERGAPAVLLDDPRLVVCPWRGRFRLA